MLLPKFVLLNKYSQPILKFEIKQAANSARISLKAATGILTMLSFKEDSQFKVAGKG